MNIDKKLSKELSCSIENFDDFETKDFNDQKN